MNNQKRYNILIFGTQGSGKGTQAKMLSKVLNIPHISPGAMYRQIQQEETDFASIVRAYINQGKLVPDTYTNDMMEKRLREPDCKNGFILDGYPRNKIQARALNNNNTIDYVIVLQLPDEISIKRISGRRECQKGHTYHIEYDPPKKEGICDIDNMPLGQREDETKEALQKRLAIYHQETEPLIEEYRLQGISIIEIDGKPPITEVTKEIKEKFHL